MTAIPKSRFVGPGVLGLPGGTRGLDASVGLPGGTRGQSRGLEAPSIKKSTPLNSTRSTSKSAGKTVTYDALRLMQRGSALWKFDKTKKYGYNNPCDFCMFKLSGKRDAICFSDGSSKLFSRLYLHSILQVVPGHCDEMTEGQKKFSFAIVYKFGREKQTIYLIAARKVDYVVWTTGLQQLLLNPFLAKFPVAVSPENPDTEPLSSVPEFTSSDRSSAICREVTLSLVTFGVYAPWAITKACKGEIVLDSRKIIDQRVDSIEQWMKEVGGLMTDGVFVLNEFRSVALEKMQYVRSRLQEGLRHSKRGLRHSPEEDLSKFSDEVFHAYAEASALFGFMKKLKLQLENPSKYNKIDLLS